MTLASLPSPALPPRRRPARAAAMLLAYALLGLSCALPPLALGADAAQAAAPKGRASSPAQPALSTEAQGVADWVRRSSDNAGLPFVLVDKRAAAVHVFAANGVLRASTPVLLGLAQGDRSVPGIGERPMSSIAPHERTTPAGRFVSEPGRNLKGEDIVWIDYDDAVSLHRVRPTNPAERRLQRLASSTVADNRISYGCVNVPTRFYDRFIAPHLGQSAGVVYVLPEMQSAASFFGFVPPARP